MNLLLQELQSIRFYQKLRQIFSLSKLTRSIRASRLSDFSLKIEQCVVSDKMVEAVLKMAVNHDKLVDFRLGQRNASNTTVSLTHGGEEAAAK